jgi:hemerythrin-like domain-containing protein
VLEDLIMDEQLSHWHAEHVNFAALLDLLEQELLAFHQGERPDYDLMIESLQYLRGYSDLVHHPREDIAFARLIDHDPTLSVTVSRLMQEHRVIAWAGEDLLQRLQETAADMLVPRADVEASASTFLVYYRHHLNMEERFILPRAAVLLQPEDWAAVAAAVPVQPDPLFGAGVELRYQGLRARIVQHQANRQRSQNLS